MKQKKILALVLIVIGVVLLGFGIYYFVEFRQSLGGKLASFGNKLSRSVNGSSKIAEGYIKPIALMVAGIVTGAVGFVLNKKS